MLRAVRERLTPPAVVATLAKEEEAGHAIVTTVMEMLKARSATMAYEDEARDVICVKAEEKIRVQVSGRE